MQNITEQEMLYIKEEVVEMPEVIYQGDLPAFTGRNVPIKEIASAIGKDAQYVRLGIQQGCIYQRVYSRARIYCSNRARNNTF